MGSIQAQIDRLTAIERRLNGGAINAVTIAGADMAAAIANRVINTGEGADGTSFSRYSKPYLLSVRIPKGLGSKKNFSVTNEMWRGFGVKRVEYSGGIYTLTLGGKTKASADKIGWMNAQEGRSIIAPNRVEKEWAVESLLRYVLNG